MITSPLSAQPQFEVTSIHLVQARPDAPHPISCSNGRFLAANVPAEYLIEWAYAVKSEISVPSWASQFGGERYNIEGKSSEPVSADDCRHFVQAMLVERFQLKVHQESREMNVYFLTVAKNGPGIHLVDLRKPADPADVIVLNGQKLTRRAMEAWMIG